MPLPKILLLVALACPIAAAENNHTECASVTDETTLVQVSKIVKKGGDRTLSEATDWETSATTLKASTSELSGSHDDSGSADSSTIFKYLSANARTDFSKIEAADAKEVADSAITNEVAHLQGWKGHAEAGVYICTRDAHKGIYKIGESTSNSAITEGCKSCDWVIAAFIPDKASKDPGCIESCSHILLNKIKFSQAKCKKCAGNAFQESWIAELGDKHDPQWATKKDGGERGATEWFVTHDWCTESVCNWFGKHAPIKFKATLGVAAVQNAIKKLGATGKWATAVPHECVSR